MKFLISNIEITRTVLDKLSFKASVKRIEDISVFISESCPLYEDEKTVGVVQGYLRNLEIPKAGEKEHSLNSFKYILDNWPLPKNITGSFSSVILEKSSGNLIVCNDYIGLYPLYYLKNERGFFISNSIISVAKVSGQELDEVGILQRAIGQDFSNIGSRTIIKNCKRLLPGEFIKFSRAGDILEKKYDNSLYQNISSPNQHHHLTKAYWEDLQKEVAACLTGKDTVKIALSGGIDSRIALGSIPNNKIIDCLTFGAKENYEVKVASRLAKLKNANFKNFYQPELYFPDYEVLKKYNLRTEAVQICSWLEIMENVQQEPDTPMLLGELCEALPARNIKKFNSRGFRQKNFFKYFIQNKDYPFERSTNENFEKWKESVLKRYLIYYGEIRLNKTRFSIQEDILKEEVTKDLEEIFSRIEAHNLPYLELYDELFSWYTFTRMRLSKQLLISNSHFNAYSPSMSLQVLRNTSNIHPNLRLNYRFVKKLFKECPELTKFRKVPIGQTPLIPQYFPDFIKFPVWGIRSKIDSYLIKKMMKSKDPSKPYRLFKSVDWAGVYQNPKMEENLNMYFSNNHLGEEFYNNLYDECVGRKNLDKWPFANIDIINAAALNLEIDYIKHPEIKRKEDI